MCSDAARPRCVTGMPAAEGAAIADVTPGTTSNSIFSFFSASISSPPRPKTNGSPPLRRTTFLPSSALSTSIFSISRCGTGWRPPSLPTFIFSARSGIIASTPSPTSLSNTIASARSMTSRPRSVSSPASPGPAPTSQTLPAAITFPPQPAREAARELFGVLGPPAGAPLSVYSFRLTGVEAVKRQFSVDYLRVCSDGGSAAAAELRRKSALRARAAAAASQRTASRYS